MDVHQTAVGAPAPTILMASLALFLVLLIRKSGRTSDEGPSRRSRLSVLGIGIQALAFVAVGIGRLDVRLAPTSPAALIQAGAVLLLSAFTCWLFAASRRALGRNWSVVARTRSDHELVTWGPFAYLRHPIYTALFAWLLGMAVAYGHYWGLILGVPLYWIGTMLRILEEERLLRTQFGPAYEAYAAKVKRFLPGIV